MLRYAIFGAVNPYYFKSFYSYGKRYLKSIYDIDIEIYLKLSQANFRINSYYLPIFEFYNLYLNGLDIKINFYIRQLYGGTELYECAPDGVSINNLDKLTTPISNSKCKNRKSLINRLFNFNGEKIITGYITPDSYFDIYAEIDKDINSIDIHPFLISRLKVDSTAKYLRKNIEYKMNFHANHLIKLEPGFDARITITNGQTTTSINPDKPTTEVSGNDFTIKSDNDAMVYFFGQFPSVGVEQVKIDNKNESHYVKISNVDHPVIIDFGFAGYLPSTYPLHFRVINNTIYLNDLYKRINTKLVNNEFLYIYYLSDTNKNLKVEYIPNNLNIKKNDFNIFYIPKNDNENGKENTIIINTENNYIIHNIKFCKKNTKINMFYTGEYQQERKIKEEGIAEIYLPRGSNRLSFTTNEPFIYSYYVSDVIDEILKKNENCWEERAVFSNLTITEVKDKNYINNKISIIFKPNYKKSSTRYIILVAQKNEVNTLDNFKEPCFITKLLNERPEGLIVEQIYDIGITDTINAIVDISPITII